MTRDEEVISDLIDERESLRAEIEQCKKTYSEGLSAWVANNKWHGLRIKNLEKRIVNAHMLLVDSVGVVNSAIEDSPQSSVRPALEELLSRLIEEIRKDWRSEDVESQE